MALGRVIVTYQDATLTHLPAREWIAHTGRHKLGIATLYERARWEITLTTTDPDFKLNNDYRAYYARLLMLCEPDLEDMFNLRASKANNWVGLLSD